MMSYSDTTTAANFINPSHDVNAMVASNDNGLAVTSANFTEANLSPGSSLVFTTTPTYPNQGLYNTIDTRPDQVNMHMSMNGVDTKGNDGKDYMNHGEFSSMHAYGTGGSGGSAGGMTLNDMNGGHNMNMTSGMQANFNMDYAHHVNHEADINHDGPNDMYMTSNNVRHMSNGVNPNSVQSGLQNFLTHNQGPPDFPRNNNFSSSISSAGLNHKSPGSSGQSYGRGNHTHSHFSQNNYTPSNGNMARNSQVMPTYVVQEIIKTETVGQYGMAGPQGPPPPPPPPQETRTLGGYQSMHHHHQHGLDHAVMPYSQQQYHTTTGNLSNNAPSSQHHHHPHQQQQQQMQTQQHHIHHHHHHQQPPLAQAANFVNMGTFPSGPYNQYQGTFGLGASNRTYSGQHQGPAPYSSGNMSSKDFTNYSGVNAGYRNTQAKRQQHFNGFTSTGVYQNHIRTQVAFNKVNQGRQQSFSKQSYSRSHPDRHRSHHGNRSKSGSGQGQGMRHTNHHHFDEGKMRQRCNSGDKVQAKGETNKYLGTEVLDDICRRLAKQANINQKTVDIPNNRDSDATEESTGSGEKSDRTEPVKFEEENSSKDQIDNDNSIKVHDGVKSSKKLDQSSEKTNSQEQYIGSRTQNHSRSYNGRYPSYPYRGPHYTRDNTRYNNTNYRVSSRNSEGRQKKFENHVKPGNLNNNNQNTKASLGAVTSNGKRDDGREEKDVDTKGAELNTLNSESCVSKDKVKPVFGCCGKCSIFSATRRKTCLFCLFVGLLSALVNSL